MSSDVPVYKFALRADLIENKEFLPTKADLEATGWDVRAAFSDRKPVTVRAGQYIKIPLGVRGFCPPGWWYQLHPRSSSFTKKELHALIGTIDETYEGELIFAAQYMPDVTKFATDLTIQFGDAIGQIIPVKRQQMIVQEITNEQIEEAYKTRNASRGAGGFGSTDVKK